MMIAGSRIRAPLLPGLIVVALVEAGCDGELQDQDGDGVADAEDRCLFGDDLLDEDANGIPDDCEVRLWLSEDVPNMGGCSNAPTFARLGVTVCDGSSLEGTCSEPAYLSGELEDGASGSFAIDRDDVEFQRLLERYEAEVEIYSLQVLLAAGSCRHYSSSLFGHYREHPHWLSRVEVELSLLEIESADGFTDFFWPTQARLYAAKGILRDP